MSILLRRAESEDESFLRELFHDVHAPEFSSLELEPAMLAHLLDMQYRAQKLGYAAQFPTAEDSIISIAGEHAGHLLLDRGSEIHLVDIALLERHRGKGIGATLIRTLCDEAKANNIVLTLSVRSGCRAEDFYRRLGFVRTGGDGFNSTMKFLP